jgi:phosphoenolpyruvate carboxylase
VARAFTVYFHLANLAEEHQRIRMLRERDAGHAAGARVARRRRGRAEHATSGREHLLELLASLRVHLVLTAHPTEARRRAVVSALRRISELLDVVDDPRAGAADRAEARRVLRENIDLLWRTSQLRVKAMDPIDEVRTVMTAFDETLFRIVPAVYRELDRALAGPASGQADAGAAFLRFGSWVGADRDGNPFVTAQVTREAATIQADHALRALETATVQDRPGADPARGDPRRRRRAAARAGRRLGRAPRAAGRDHRSLPAGALPDLPAVRRAAAGATRTRQRRPGLPGPGGVPGRPAGGPGVAGGGRGRQAGLRRAAAPDLAGRDVRLPPGRPGGQAAQRGARPGAGRAAGRRAARRGPRRSRTGLQYRSAETRKCWPRSGRSAWIQDRFGVDACRRYVVSFTRSADDIAAVYELARYAMAGGRIPVLDVVPLFESAADLANAPDVLTGMLALPEVTERLAANGRELEAMLGYSDSAKELGPASATLRLFDAQAKLAEWAAGHDVSADLVPRPGRRARPRRRAGRPGRARPGARFGQRVVQGHRAGRGDLRPVRPAGHRQTAPGAGQLGGAARLVPRIADRNAAAAATYRGVADRIDEAARSAFRGPGRGGRVRRVVRPDQPAGRDRRLRIGSRPAKRGLAPARRRLATMDLDDLRAIPWVFAWSQTRMNLPGWFGLGSGLAAIGADPDGRCLAAGVLRAAEVRGAPTATGRCSACCSTTPR